MVVLLSLKKCLALIFPNQKQNVVQVCIIMVIIAMFMSIDLLLELFLSQIFEFKSLDNILSYQLESISKDFSI